MSDTDVAPALDHNSTERFFIEHEGFKSNHLAHGAIALHRLGEPNARIQRFIRRYSTFLESTSSDSTDDRPVEELKGKRVAYYSILKHFEALLREKYKNVEELIKNEYPGLSKGLGGSLLHGTIHLGYGFSVKNERVILEGLAYTFHSYMPIKTANTVADLAVFGSGSVEITEVLKSLRLNKELTGLMKEGIKEDRWKPFKLNNKFQLALSYLLTDHGDLLTNLVLSLAFGPEVRASDSSLDPVKLGRRIVYLSGLVYAKAENRNDFFLLHGVTCAWGLHQIIPLLMKEDVIKAVREFLTVLLAVYVVAVSPDLNVSILSGEVTDKDWTELVRRGVDVDRDEHCYKVLQVCYEMSTNAKENGEDPNVYVQSAKSVLDYDFYFNTIE